MQFGQRKEDRLPFSLNWQFYTLSPGESFEAYVAGPMIWTPGHYVKTHKGCARVISDEAIPCPWCGHLDDRDLGYLPLYTTDMQQRVVGIGNVAKRGVSRLKCHSGVTISKGGHKLAPNTVKINLKMMKFLPDRDTEHEVDIHDWCMMIWKLPELRKWWQEKKSNEEAQRLLAELQKPATAQQITLETPTASISVSKSKLSDYNKRIADGLEDQKKKVQEADRQQRNGTH